MSQRPALSKTEIEVARVVWSLGEVTVREVFDSFPPDRGHNFATVQTYLRRLEAKGYLTRRSRGRVNVYSPRVSPNQVIRETVEDFIGRLFDGQAIPFFEHLIQDRGINAEEVHRLRELLDRWESEDEESSGK